MTNEERLQQAQAREYRSRYVVFAVALVILVALLSFVAVQGKTLLVEHERKEAERIAAEEEASRQAEEAERLAKEEAERLAAEQSAAAEASRLAEESAAAEASRLAEEEANRIPEGYVEKEFDEDQLYQGYLQLINKDYAYQFKEDDNLVLLYDEAGGGYYMSDFGIQMERTASYEFNRMLMDFYYETWNGNILVLNGWRSLEEAQALFDEDSDYNGIEHAESHIMLPGYSEHHSGLASDLGLYYTEDFLYEYNEEYPWLAEHAHEYGFVIRYPENKTEITDIAFEPWHYRYVGPAPAAYMYANDLCLEEFIDLMREHTIEDPLIVEVGDTTYTLYYAEGTTAIVPEDGNYEVSGNNVDGLIITLTSTSDSTESDAE